MPTGCICEEPALPAVRLAEREVLRVHAGHRLRQAQASLLRHRLHLGDQARFLAWSEYLAWRNPAVKLFAQFLLRALPPRPGPTARDRWADFQSGLRTVDGRPKPAERRLRRALRGLDE